MAKINLLPWRDELENNERKSLLHFVLGLLH